LRHTAKEITTSSKCGSAQIVEELTHIQVVQTVQPVALVNSRTNCKQDWVSKLKITQKLCVSIGGHCWKPRGANYSTTQPDGSPRFRECKHCGRKEDLKLKGVKGKERWSNGQHGYSKEDWKNIQEGMK